MSQNEAKVKISGDASGAARANDQAARGIQAIGTTANKVNQDIARGTDQATAAEKKFESEVQRAINRLKQKETTARATAAAVRRMGEDGPGSTRGAVAGAGGPGVGGGMGAGRLLTGVGGGLGGQGGALMGRMGAAAAGGAALMGVVAAASLLTMALGGLTQSSEAAARAAGERVRVEQERAALEKQAQQQLGQTALAVSSKHGTSAARLAMQGVSIDAVRATGDRTGADAGQALELASLLRGLGPELRKQIEQAFVDAEKLGGSGLDAARSLSVMARESGGSLGNMSRGDMARMGLGSYGDQFSDQEINRGLNRPTREGENLASLRRSRGRQSLAELGTLTDASAIQAADVGTREAAAAAADPLTAALGKHTEVLRDQIAVMNAMAAEEGPLVRGLKDLAAAIKGGGGSYTTQAARQRAVIAGAGG